MNYKLTTQILIAMIVGVCTGLLLRENAVVFQPLEIYLLFIKYGYVAFIFASLVVGVVNLGSVQSLGRLGARTSIYYL